MPIRENLRLRERVSTRWNESTRSLLLRVPAFRAARLQEAPALSELCVRSKAVWGYDETFMARVRAALRIRPERIDAGDVWVATAADGSIAGIVALGPSDQPRTLDLDKLFVAPRRIGSGIGRM